MDARNLDGLHLNDIVQRQGLGGVIGGLLGGGETTPTQSSVSASASATAAPQNDGDPLLGGLTSVINGVTSILPLPSESSTSLQPTTKPLTVSSSSSTGSATSTTATSSSSSTTAQSKTSTSSTPTSSSKTSTSSATPTPPPSSTPASTPILVTSSTGGTVVVVTEFVQSSATATNSPTPGFLENKPLEGGVFAAVGIVVMILIFIVVTMACRRRRRSRLDREIADAVSFDPTVTEHYVDEERRLDSIEKYRLSGSSSGHGHGFDYGGGYTQPTYAPPPPQGYYGQGYGQQPTTYAPRAPSPQGAGYNNYNNQTGLVRSPSDRKPVPPLLPEPVYDPSHSQLPHFGNPGGAPFTPYQGRSVSPNGSPSVDLPREHAMPPGLPDTYGDAPPGVLKIANE